MRERLIKAGAPQISRHAIITTVGKQRRKGRLSRAKEEEITNPPPPPPRSGGSRGGGGGGNAIAIDSTDDDDVMKQEKLLKKRYEGLWSTHLLVASLVATGTFAAGFSVPGGYYTEEEGPKKQGTPFLLRQAAFIAFAVMDVLSTISSTSAMLLYLGSAIIIKISGVPATIGFAIGMGFNLVSVTLMVLAFATGSYAVLAPLPSLAAPMCVVTSVYCVGVYVYGASCFVRVKREAGKAREAEKARRVREAEEARRLYFSEIEEVK